MSITRHIPNALTCGNILCGCLGVVATLEGWSTPAAYFVWAAGVFDFFDGFAARWLKVSSPIGKELDSLADMVSFGLLPAMVMYKLLAASSTTPYLPYLAFLIAVASGLRLAIFNVDDSQQYSFRGLNTPANALFITSLIFLPTSIQSSIMRPEVLTLITVLFSWLLISPIDIIAFKFKNFSWADNKLRFTFLLVAVLLLVAFQLPAIPLIILLYIVFSLAGKVLKLKG